MYFTLDIGWPLETALRYARVAAKHNFDGLTSSEHHLPGSMPSPLMWLTRFVGEFPQLRFGTDVALPLFYHPVRMASEAAILDHMTSGKFTLGIGLGYVKSEFDLHGIDIKKRRSMFEESLTIMKKLWTGDEVTFEGKYFRVRGRLPLKPLTPGGPRIWMGGQVRVAIERAARMGDAFVGGTATPIQRFSEFTNTYREALKKLGKDPNQADIPIMRIVWCDMKENARDEINKIVSDQFRRTIAVSDGHPMQFDKNATDYEHAVENRCIVGTPDTCIEMIEKYAKLGVTGILCSFVTTEHTVEQVEESIRLFGDEVIGYFRGFV